MKLLAHLFHYAGQLLGEQHKLSERERIREVARQMNRDMNRPIPKALRR